MITAAGRPERRGRLYHACAPQNAGCDGGVVGTLVHRRDIHPRLPLSSTGWVIDMGSRFRHLNMALVNEFVILARELRVDIWEAVRAASTKSWDTVKREAQRILDCHDRTSGSNVEFL